MIKKEDLQIFINAAQILKSVAHPKRLAIIQCLTQEEKLSVGKLQIKLQITQSMTSQHLASLRNVGIVGCEKEANICYYYILNKNILKLLDCVKQSAKSKGEKNV